MNRIIALFLASVAALPLACAASGGDDGVEGETERDTESLTPGVNGGACAKSPYNCKLRVDGGNRVETNDVTDANAWNLDLGVPVQNGNGDVVAINDKSSTTFNFGQLRDFGGVTYAFAVTTSNGSAGWMPLSAIHGHGSFAAKVGHVTAHAAGLGKLGCYEIRNGHDAAIELKKVVWDSQSGPGGHERAGDYQALPRNNGVRSANLTFNVPGFSLGGVAIDHFPAGTKLQRLDVPTSSGAPSIDIPLWVQDAAGRYRKHGGDMKFIYGYVVAKTGDKRVGWMAYDALQVSSGCP